MSARGVSVCRFRGCLRELRGKAVLPDMDSGNENGRRETRRPL